MGTLLKTFLSPSIELDFMVVGFCSQSIVLDVKIKMLMEAVYFRVRVDTNLFLRVDVLRLID